MKIILDFKMDLGPFGPKTAQEYAGRVEYALQKAAHIVQDECIEEDFFGRGIEIRRHNNFELIAVMDIEEDEDENS